MADFIMTIGGAPQPAVGSFGVVNPATGEVFAAAPDCTPDLLDGAMTAAAKAFPDWSTDDDLAGGGSDRLVDSLVAWGDEAAVARRVQDHVDAGADHVCVQVLTEDRTTLPLDVWRRLASALVDQ